MLFGLGIGGIISLGWKLLSTAWKLWWFGTKVILNCIYFLVKGLKFIGIL